MSTINSTMGVYGLISNVSTVTNGQTLAGDIGQALTRLSMPLVDIEQGIDAAWDGSGDALTIDLETGGITGQVTGVKATGSVVLTGLPANNDTVTINAIVYTFKTTASLATEIQIGADATATAANLATKVGDNDAAITLIAASGTVTISAAETGAYGNAITLAESAANTAVSGANLTGGVDKVTATNDGTDSLGTARATAALVHGLMIKCTSGSITIAIGSVVKDTLLAGEVFQTLSAAGRADLIDDLVLTSAAVNTTAETKIRASA